MRIQAKNKLEMMDKELEVEAQKKKDNKR